MAFAYKSSGYCAICVTDHFFNGNTCILSDNQTWFERISLFVKGYEDAKKEGSKIGLDVYFGFEFCNNGNEFLIYNYGEEKLRAYPEIMTDNIFTVLEKIRDAGGFIVHAHPFRTASYIPKPGRMFPEYVDAVEIVNTSNQPDENTPAKEYAEKYNLIKFGGSDSHSINNKLCGGMAFMRKPKSFEDIIDMAKKEECVILEDKI